MTNRRTIQARKLQPFISQSASDTADVVVSETFASGIILFHVDGSAMTVYPGTGAGLTAAMAAAIDGDLALLPNMAFTVSFTIPAGVKVCSLGNCDLSGQVTLGGNDSILERVHVGRSASSAGALAGVVGPATGTAAIKNCWIDVTNSGAGAAYAVQGGAGLVEVWTSDLYGNASGGGSGYAVIAGAGDVHVYGGVASGSTARFETTSGDVKVQGVDGTPSTGETPLASDRAVFDATNYASIHANDTDGATTSIHHTIGTAANQAAAGNHTHGGGLADGTWIDYSGSSTVTGWSGFNVKKLYYKKTGTTVLVQFDFFGTSNSTNTAFTLPYANNSGAQVNSVFNAMDSGTVSFGTLQMDNTNTTVSLSPTPASGDGWTASGNKDAYGEFWYYTTG